MDPQRIRICTQKEYDVIIGKDLLPLCGTYIREVVSPCRMAVITDSNVAPLYLDGVESSLTKAGFETHSFVFPAGESSKNIKTLSDILEFLGEIPLTRTDCVVALGGGVTGDMAGFAAGCYLRGIRYIQIPTTFLAAVDSSVGGKTAVNLGAGKNLAGLFLQPELVLCDIATFRTLTPEIFADGTAEAIKTAILGNETMFSLFETENIHDHIEEIVSFCVTKKGEIVTGDEREQGLRRLLNLGHTIGHAIEKCSSFSITHGHAVAMGMAIVARASLKNGWSEEDCLTPILNSLNKFRFPLDCPYSAAELTQAALKDKKRMGDTITLVIPVSLGNCQLKKIPVEELGAFIEGGLACE